MCWVSWEPRNISLIRFFQWGATRGPKAWNCGVVPCIGFHFPLLVGQGYIMICLLEFQSTFILTSQKFFFHETLQSFAAGGLTSGYQPGDTFDGSELRRSPLGMVLKTRRKWELNYQPQLVKAQPPDFWSINSITSKSWQWLGGGFKNLLFSPLLGEMIQFD